MTSHVLVIGATGVVGSAVARHFTDSQRWKVTSVSRRATGLAGAEHVSVDLLDEGAVRAALAGLGEVTHVVYAACADRPTMAEAVAPNLAMLTHVMGGLEAAGRVPQRVVLIGGGKSYGEHLGPYKTPARESDPRHLGPILYIDQEDFLKADAARRGYEWAVLRPDVVIGPSTGSAMNLLTAIAAYATLCRQAGVPLRFPGSPAAWTALHQITDASLLSEAAEWALTATGAADEIFNVTDGDQIRWLHVWPDIAEVFEMPAGPPQPMSLSVQMSDKAAVWDQLITEHQLDPTPLEEFVSWSFADAVWSMGFDLLQSTIKIRQAGFSACRDSATSLVDQLRSLRRNHLLPRRERPSRASLSHFVHSVVYGPTKQVEPSALDDALRSGRWPSDSSDTL